jgi:hypothetical protein
VTISKTWWAVSALVGLFVALGAWSLSSSVGASPDDDFHLASIWCGAGEKPGLCEDTGQEGHRLVLPGLVQSGCYVFEPAQSAECQEENQIFTRSTLIDTTRGSFISNYPPVYYAMMSGFATSDIPLSVIAIRIINSLFFIGSLVALIAIAPRAMRKTYFWMWALTIVPLGIFLISSTNPSSWAITGVPTAWMALYLYLTQTGKRSVAAGTLFFVEAFLVSGARGDAAIYTIIGSVFIVFLTWQKTKSFAQKLILPFASALISLYFYTSSLQSTVASSGMTISDGGVPRTAFGVLAINLVQLPELWVGAFGFWPLGWLDTQMPALVWVTTFGFFVAVVFLLVKGVKKRQAFVLLGLAAILYLLPLYVLQRSLNHVGEQVQPRYLLPLIVGFTAVACLKFAEAKPVLSQLQSWVILAGIVIANALALYVNTKRYVSGLNNGTGINLDSNIGWWWDIPLSPMTVWIIGALGFALAATAGFTWIQLQAGNQVNSESPKSLV